MSEPQGKFIKINELEFYYSPPPQTSKKVGTVCYFPDVFGHRFINAQIIADLYAKEAGVHVYVPDITNGDPIDSNLLKTLSKDWSFSKVINVLGMTPTFLSWFYKHRDSITLPICEKAAKIVREMANKEGNGLVSCIGFCFGGRYTILGSSDRDWFDSYVVCHPSRVSFPNDIEAITKPGLYLLPEKDFGFKPKQITLTKEILSKNKIEFSFILYQGVDHGFAVRINDEQKIFADASISCKDRAVEFFKKNLTKLDENESDLKEENKEEKEENKESVLKEENIESQNEKELENEIKTDVKDENKDLD
jgi:carboxymethylenebutenolidase